MVNNIHFSFYGKQAIVHSNGNICKDELELTESALFSEIIKKYIADLRKKDSPLLGIFKNREDIDSQQEKLVLLLALLSLHNKDEIQKQHPEYASFFLDCSLLHEFVERLYNFWRNYERFFVLYAHENDYHLRPFRSFHDTVGTLNDLVRKVYRDICKNITGIHPTVYRQIPAGFQVGIIAHKENLDLLEKYSELSKIPIIKQVMINPPMIIDPPTNTRSGEFKKIDKNPLLGVTFNSKEWLCYPAKVGNLLIFLYFHQKFIGLGTATANLFDMPSESEMKRKPDAIYAYGIDENHFSQFGDNHTVFFEDGDLLIGAVPGSDKYGYFGYIKKMMLTLHNIIMMRKGRMPVHGAMVKIELKNGKSANVAIMGDSGAGKSESLEAFRMLAGEHLRDMTVIFDDMGSIEIKDEKIIAYGTETGAFVRLDDLQPGFAFGNMDRSIIMSPQKINARVVIPITTLKEILQGYAVDYFLYANNYEQVDESHPYLEQFANFDEAFAVFKHAARIAKGTTSEKGLVHTYFANPFGPVQYKEMHEKIAQRHFKAMFESKIVVGQLRTKLGIDGQEITGPQNAAKALFEHIMKH